MTERETEQTKELADIIVEKFRNLFVLESRVLEAREQAKQIAANHDTTEPSNPQENPTTKYQETLAALESQLKEGVAEMEEIIDELNTSAALSFRTYVLPQMSEIVGTLKACDAAKQEELTQFVPVLTDEGHKQSLEQLEAIIITRLRDNLERTFGT